MKNIIEKMIQDETGLAEVRRYGFNYWIQLLLSTKTKMIHRRYALRTDN